MKMIINVITLKRPLLVLIFMLLGCVAIQAADDLITQQITIKLDEAGTLPDKIDSTEVYKITNLKIIGEINGTDLRMIRDMAGRVEDLHPSGGKLATLDLSEVKIVSGGGCYDSSYYTEDNVLGNSAFAACSSLVSVVTPYSVTLIGNWAFAACSSLASVVIPSGVTSIGSHAFDGCSSLASVVMSPGVTSIGDYAFYGCSSLTSIEIPSGVTLIGDDAFEDCSSLASVVIPSSVTSVGDNAFCRCSSLMNIEIPAGVTSVGDCAFWRCSSLANVEIPSSVTSIGDGVFYDCSSLASIVIPSSITTIGNYVFEKCSSLASVVIPSSVTSIGYQAFDGCRSLTSIKIPSGVTSIGNYAFEKCSSLARIYVGWETPVAITSYVFYYVDKKKCTLYVPQGTSQDYMIANLWGDFANIVEYDAAGIEDVVNTTDLKEISRYSLNGQQLTAPTKGVNIVKYSDGSVRKIVVQ